jgi:hypothetical protein
MNCRCTNAGVDGHNIGFTGSNAVFYSGINELMEINIFYNETKQYFPSEAMFK